MQQKNYDYIFLGAGCASLSIIMRMIASKRFEERKILLVDREQKNKNDRTWCFWEQEAGFFEDIVLRKWTSLLFKTDDISIPLETGRYKYKMIRGIDFYQKCFNAIRGRQNIDTSYGEISFEQPGKVTALKINDTYLYPGNKTIIFNSLYVPSAHSKKYFQLLQHFKGWIIETEADSFDTRRATLMDFSVSQQYGTSFVYVLPLSSRKALVEYTLFTENLLAPGQYDIALKDYLDENAGPVNYSIIDQEFGVIPMTNEIFPFYKNGMYWIGTAGGQTKASTGYTFTFIQKQADTIVEELISKGKLLNNRKAKKRFHFYDSTLLHILSKKLLPGKTIFTILFTKNPADKVLKFLDNETTVAEEIKLLNSLPKKIFIKAGIIELFKLVFAGRKS
jgi:lycopene beta-cyclase